MSIEVNIRKKLGSFQLNMEFTAGDEILSLLGGSGCGKSLTLKCIAGIEKPDEGRIVLNGRTLFDSEKHINLTPQQRRIGFLFQNYALFPNMTVRKNILAGVRKGVHHSENLALAEQYIESFGLSGVAEQYPTQLSGGQQQRTALARILVNEPELLLLDEPFSALDTHLRFRLEQEVNRIIREYGKGALLVSHNRDEVFRLSDSIAVISNGRIEAYGTRDEVFADPQTRAGAQLTGCKNISRAKRLDENHVYAEDWDMTLEIMPTEREIAYIGIRLHDVQTGEGTNSFSMQLAEEIENPFDYQAMFHHGNAPSLFGIELGKSEWLAQRDAVMTLHLPPQKILLLRE